MNLKNFSLFRNSTLISVALMMTILLSFDVRALGIAISAENLIDQAELVIIGKVVSKTGNKMELNAKPPDKTNEQETYFSIMTKYEVEITKIQKGEYEDKTINVYSFGGRAGNEIEHWSFGYDFAVGDEALLFLEKSKANKIWMAVQQSSGAFLLVNREGYWQVSSVNSDDMVVRGGGDIRTIQQNDIEKLEMYINEGKR